MEQGGEKPVHKAFQFCLYPTKEQEDLINKHLVVVALFLITFSLSGTKLMSKQGKD
jgi:hypothetical protein